MDAELLPDPILPIVERFLSEVGMTATEFGQRSVKDPKFVHELRRGRECRRATRARVLTFIEACKTDAP
jgi:hypothetical protein